MKNPFLAPILEPQPDLSTYAVLPKHCQHWKSVCNNNCALTVGVSVSLCFRPLQPRSGSTKTRCRPSVSSSGRRTAPSSSSPPPTDRSTSSTRTASSSTPSSHKKFRPKTRISSIGNSYAGVFFSDARVKSRDWIFELILVDYSGRINSFLLSPSGYQVTNAYLGRDRMTSLSLGRHS